ncbi:MAG TPA: 4-alpha-glucanotransferase [Rhizomicrobium sp.]|nr:4-alpha-glucanotransferase [Rhizomicrobium sp.]
MNDDVAVVALAREAGLAVEWTDAHGTPRTVGIETLRAVLAALDLPAGSKRDMKDSRARLRQEKNRTPPLTIVRAGEAVSLDGEKSAAIEAEDGTARTVRLRKSPDGRTSFRAPREPGYYRMESGGKETALAVAPARALSPQDIAGHGGLAGVSVQIYALRGGTSGGFGDFAALGSFARGAGRAGFHAVMASPTHALFGAGPARFSPYSPSTRLFLNPLFADQTLAGGPKLGEPHGEDPLIDWGTAAARKSRVLRQAFATFRRAGTQGRFETFCRDGGERLLAHALFETLDTHFRGRGIRGFRNWPAGFESPAGTKVADFAKHHRRDVEYQLFLQWLAARSAEAAQKNARSTMAIGIVADLAVGMDPQGSHAWSAPQELLSGLHVGAPPDIFNTQGQDWGLTTLSPRALPTLGFVPFIATLRAAMRHAGGVRIDHALGLRRLWVVPAGASASEGVYISYPEESLLRLIALESHRHRAVVVGEDLGTVPQGFRADLAEAGVLGMQVLWFERDGGEFAKPSTWRREAMATTTTHDLPTVAGWWTERDIDWRKYLGHLQTREAQERAERGRDRARLWAALKAARCATGDMPAQESFEAAVEGALAYVGGTRCTLAFAPVEDLAADTEQPNLPGTIDEHPNWRRRMKKGDFLRDRAARQRMRAFLAARTPS